MRCNGDIILSLALAQTPTHRQLHKTIGNSWLAVKIAIEFSCNLRREEGKFYFKNLEDPILHWSNLQHSHSDIAIGHMLQLSWLLTSSDLSPVGIVQCNWSDTAEVTSYSTTVSCRISHRNWPQALPMMSTIWMNTLPNMTTSISCKSDLK